MLLKQYKIRNRYIKCPGMLTPGSVGELTFMHLWQHHMSQHLSRALNTASHNIPAPLVWKPREGEKGSLTNYHDSLKRYHHQTTPPGFCLARHLRNTNISTLFPAQQPFDRAQDFTHHGKKLPCAQELLQWGQGSSQTLWQPTTSYCRAGTTWQKCKMLAALSIILRHGQITQAAN